MNTFTRFAYEMFSNIAEGFKAIFEGLGKGFQTIFSFERYKSLITFYAEELKMSEQTLTVIVVFLTVLVLGLLVYLILFLIRKYLVFHKNVIEEEDLLEEIDKLNTQVTQLAEENEKILELKSGFKGRGQLPGTNDDGTPASASQANPDGEEGEGATDDEDGPKSDMESVPDDAKRFPQLFRIDMENQNTKIIDFHNTETLEQVIDNFRCFAASKLRLYYEMPLLRCFFGGLASGKMLILQGISGTGKTSLSYAWSKFNKLTPCVASVQPSWRDRTDFFGYINDFTKKYTETDALVEIYSALYDDRIHTIILDEMNLARVEYYFAEVLSILEMPNRDEWIITLITSHDPNDPKRFINGKLKLGGNIWYIGTINNDDSTFQVTDKVYDRAMPIDINTKVAAFACREQEAMDLNSVYLEKLFKKAQEDLPVTETNMKKIEAIDDYMITHFRISFGNRIMKQLRVFVPVYKGCGGDEVDGIDYFICKKILRKLEQQNIAYIKDEFDPFIKLLHETFGDDKFGECIAYLELLKKND